MNTDELLSRVKFQQIGTGQYKVIITYRGKEYTGRTNNTLAIDRLHENETLQYFTKRNAKSFYTTAKQAAQSLYDEVKRQNGL